MLDEKTVDLRTNRDFRICDSSIRITNKCYSPNGNDVLRGRVVDLSDGGELDSSFAEIEVDQVEQRVIVPINRILGIFE